VKASTVLTLIADRVVPGASDPERPISWQEREEIGAAIRANTTPAQRRVLAGRLEAEIAALKAELREAEAREEASSDA
jgi:hypothetical protein